MNKAQKNLFVVIRAPSVHFNIQHPPSQVPQHKESTMLRHLSLKVILYKNNMHMSLKRVATVLRIKIHHHHSYIQKTAMLSVLQILAEFIYLFIYEIVIQFHSYETMLKKDGYFMFSIIYISIYMYKCTMN